jgi:predicted dehydrogenase
MSYSLLTCGMRDVDIRRKKVLVLGAGSIALEYGKALKALGVTHVTFISRKEESAQKIRTALSYESCSGGYASYDAGTAAYDLCIVALPIGDLKAATEYAVSNGIRNVLVEKPGALYSSILREWANGIHDDETRVRVAYNRLMYPSFWKVKELTEGDGGITSCRYTFTEWTHCIPFEKDAPEVYERWGISNSLHVISMAHDLIGMPRASRTYRTGGLSWHSAGSRFVGAGMTVKNIPFSYHADWDSAGRWGIEVHTQEYAYRLIPLEQLRRCRRSTVEWQDVPLSQACPGVKTGIAEEMLVMLQPELEISLPLMTLQKAAVMTQWAEDVLGYEHVAE